MRHIHLPSGFGVELALWDIPKDNASAAKQVDGKGLVDKCHGADAGSCKVIAGHHSFNGSATSFVQRTEWDAGAPVTNVTISSGHVDAGGDEFVLLVEPSKLDTTLWAVLTPGFMFDCAVQTKSGVTAGEFLSFCGAITEAPSGSRNLVTAAPSGRHTGFLTVVCPGGASCGGPPAGVTLPPHSIAVPLSGGAVSLSGLGPATTDTPQPKPTWRTTEAAKAIVTQRLAEVTAKLDRDYPRSTVGQMRDSAEAMRTVMGWNTVWDQRVKVITPVSRTFGVNPFISASPQANRLDGVSLADRVLLCARSVGLGHVLRLSARGRVGRGARLLERVSAAQSHHSC